MDPQDFSDLTDTIATRHPLRWRAAGVYVLDANGKLVLVCTGAPTPYDSATLAQFVATAANLAVIGEAATVDGFARSMAEADRAQVALSTAEAERDEARAEVARLRARLAALDLSTYPCASYDEPGASVRAPRGWEWAGEWYPSGAVTTEGVPVWRRAVRRVLP